MAGVLALAAAPMAFAQFAWSQPAEPTPRDGQYPLLAPGDGVVSDFRRDAVAQIYGPEGLYHGDLYRLVIDHGGGVTTEYLFKTSAAPFRIGDRVRTGQAIAPEGASQGAPATNTPDAEIDLSRPDGKTCFEPPEPTCFFHAGYMRGTKSASVATNDPYLYVSGRLVRADLIVVDEESKHAFAHGSVSTTAAEISAALARPPNDAGAPPVPNRPSKSP